MKVSIIMPCYNAEATLEESIQSVLDQTFPEFELILIDDGSRDATRSIMEQYQLRDSRIRVLCNQENRGVSYTRNFGIREARYDWIALLDGDDCWPPDKLKKQVAAVDQNPGCALFFTGSSFMTFTGERSGYIFHAKQRVTYQDLLYQNLIPCSSVMVKREAMLKHPMNEAYAVGEDYITWLQILKEYGYAVGVDEPLLVYRLSSKSLPKSKMRSARIQWQTYRKYIHLPLLKSCYFFGNYALRNLKKYMGIKFRKTGPSGEFAQAGMERTDEGSKTTT